MKSEKYISVLGKYFGEPEITSFLLDLGITEKPKLKRGDDTTHLTSAALGIELTFRVSNTIKIRNRDYPEGALVLCNVGFYGVKTEDFSRFKDDLPFGIVFGDKKSTLISKLGELGWKNTHETLLRWDLPNLCVFATLDSNSSLEVFTIQLPIVQV